MLCAICYTNNANERDYCEACGAFLLTACRTCRAVVHDGSEICAECSRQKAFATNQDITLASTHAPRDLVPRQGITPSHPESERRQVTSLFCDIVDSTPLSERLGPDSMLSLVDCFCKIAGSRIEANGGVVSKFLGDGFVAVFGIPVSLEGHAVCAVQAAIEIHSFLRGEPSPARSREIQKTLGHDLAALEALRHLQVRIGINTGVVVLGTVGDESRADYTAIGDTMNVAARLQQIADPGKIFVSETTHRLVRDTFPCQSLGARTIKGKVDRIPVYRISDQPSNAPSTTQSKPTVRSPILGREKEIACLTEAMAELRRGHGSVIFITGEAGIGKSRLMAEVKRLAAAQDVLWLEGRSRSLGQMLSYLPFQEILRFASDTRPDDANEVCWRKLETRITGLFGSESSDILPYLATLLKLNFQGEFDVKIKYLNAQSLGHQIFRSTRLFFSRLAQERPLILLFEDCHWIDKSSAELLQHILSLVESSSIAICMTGRSEITSQVFGTIKASLAPNSGYVKELALNALTPFDCGVLLRNLLQSSDLTPSLVELISRKAEGNPLFIEEVVYALIDVGGVYRDSDSGSWRISEKAEEVTIPDSIHALIRARIDRLRDDLKRTIKTASVLGRNFFYRVLCAVEDPTFAQLQNLVELERLQLLLERNKSPEIEYSFRHALVHDSAYESIVQQRRRELHHLAAVALQELYPDRLHEFYGTIAYHYAKAGDSVNARSFLLKLADQASSIAADSEALAHYHQALSAYQDSLDSESDRFERAVLERKIGEALFRRGHHDSALACLNRALSLLRNENPFSSSSTVRRSILKEILKQGWHRWTSSRRGRPAISPIKPKDEECVNIYVAIAWIHYFGNREAYLLSVLLTTNFAEKCGSSRLADGLSALGSILDVLSFSKIANRYHRRAISLAESEKNLATIGQAHLLFAMHNHYQGRWSDALTGYATSASLFQKAGHIRGWGAATSCRAWILNSQGKLSQTRILANELCEFGRDARDPQVLGWGLAHLGKITRNLGGSLLEAISYTEEALKLFETIPDLHTIAAIRVDLGDIYLRAGQIEQSMQVLQEAGSLMQKNKLRSLFVAPINAILAEAYLTATRIAKPNERTALLSRAYRAWQNSHKQMRYCPAIAPLVYRAGGNYHWLCGNPKKAKALWQQSLNAANVLGAKYESAKTFSDKGRFMGSAEDLSAADRIFSEIGLLQDLRALEKKDDLTVHDIRKG